MLARVGRDQFTAAQRWVARARMDENSCQPCKDNNGQTYRNRASAYADYPGGRGYIHCEGQTNCRCVVVKRRGASNEMNVGLAAKLVGSHTFSARTLAAPIYAKLGMAAPDASAPAQFRAAAATTDQPASLYIYDAIGGWDGIQPIDVVRALAGVTGPLAVHINSVGGSIWDGSAIYNAIAGYSGGAKTAYIDGVAASAASFIMLACDEVVMAANAVTMVHDGAGFAFGTADDIRDLADVLDMLSDTIAATYAARAGGTAQHWREVMRSGDTWFNAEQTVAQGLAHRIDGAASDESDDDQPGESDDEPDESDSSNKFDIGVFVAVESSTPTDVSRETVAPPFPAMDVEGMRAALKGAFA